MLFGDRQAADKWQVHKRTVERYRQRLTEDPQLSAFVANIIQQEQHGWRTQRLDTLRAALDKMKELMGKAYEAHHLPAVTDAFRALAETQIALEALGVDSALDSESGEVPEDSGHSSQSQSEESTTEDPVEPEVEP